MSRSASPAIQTSRRRVTRRSRCSAGLQACLENSPGRAALKGCATYPGGPNIAQARHPAIPMSRSASPAIQTSRRRVTRRSRCSAGLQACLENSPGRAALKGCATYPGGPNIAQARHPAIPMSRSASPAIQTSRRRVTRRSRCSAGLQACLENSPGRAALKGCATYPGGPNIAQARHPAIPMSRSASPAIQTSRRRVTRRSRCSAGLQACLENSPGRAALKGCATYPGGPNIAQARHPAIPTSRSASPAIQTSRRRVTRRSRCSAGLQACLKTPVRC